MENQSISKSIVYLSHYTYTLYEINLNGILIRKIDHKHRPKTINITFFVFFFLLFLWKTIMTFSIQKRLLNLNGKDL